MAFGAPVRPPRAPDDDRPPRAGWGATIAVVLLVLVAVATGVVMLGGDDRQPPEDSDVTIDTGRDDGDDEASETTVDGFALPEGEIPEDAFDEQAGSGTIPFTTEPDPYAGLPDVTRDQVADALAAIYRRDLADCVADTLVAVLPQQSLNRVYYASALDELTAYEERETEAAWRGCVRHVLGGG